MDKYAVITLNKIFNCRKQLLFYMFTIILFTLIPLSFIKNGFVAPYQEIPAETINFLYIFTFVNASKFSSGTSDFSPFPYPRLFCKLTGTSRVTFFLSCILFFESDGCCVQTFQLMLWCERIFYCDTHRLFGSSYSFKLTRVSSFNHSSN